MVCVIFVVVFSNLLRLVVFLISLIFSLMCIMCFDGDVFWCLMCSCLIRNMFILKLMRLKNSFMGIWFLKVRLILCSFVCGL